MALIQEKDRQYLKQMFDGFQRPVKLLVFTRKESKLVVPGARRDNCAYCKQTVQLVEELGSISDMVTHQVLDIEVHLAEARQYGIDKVPAIVVLGEGDRDYGIRFFGIPAGYEFATLVEDIADVAAGKTRLSEETRQVLAGIDSPVLMRVFVTPT